MPDLSRYARHPHRGHGGSLLKDPETGRPLLKTSRKAKALLAAIEAEHAAKTAAGTRAVPAAAAQSRANAEAAAARRAANAAAAKAAGRSGLCACGCGQPTRIADRTDPERGDLPGAPRQYRRGHAANPPKPPPPPPPWTEADTLAALKLAAEADLYLFAAEVCEYGENPTPGGPRVTEDQREAAAWLDGVEARRALWNLMLTPRGTLKSTLLEAYVVKRLAKNPNLRVLLYGEVHEQAQKRLAKVKRLIQHGVIFRQLYGDLDGSKLGLPWNEDMATLAAKTQHAAREANIETGGLDVVVNARHFDLIIVDDIESEKNTKTREQIEAIKEKLQLLIPLLDQGGQIVVAGVFWSDGDAHTWLVEEVCAPEAVFRRTIYVEDVEDGGTPRYPHTHPKPAIAEIRKSLRSDLFSCHYLLTAVSSASAMFREDQFPVAPKASFTFTRTFLCVDPAGDPTAATQQRKDSDYMGLVAWGVTANHDLVLLDAVHVRFDPTAQVEQALVLVMRHKPDIIGIERAAMGNLRYYLTEAMRKRGLYGLIHDCLPNGRTKLDRILSLKPLADLGRIYFAQEAQGRDIFLAEITKVQRGAIKARHDDVIDAAAYVLDLLKEYGTPSAAKDEEAEWREQLKTLNPESAEHWMAVKKADAKAKSGAWAAEFCN